MLLTAPLYNVACTSFHLNINITANNQMLEAHLAFKKATQQMAAMLSSHRAGAAPDAV